MLVKVNFLVYFSVCFIGSIFCVKSVPFNPSPYAPRKQYYLSDPTEKVDVVEATAKCLAMQMTLATVDDMQDQEILVDQLRKDYSRYGNLGLSEFWLVDPNGLNDVKSIKPVILPLYPSSMALPHNIGQKCVKLVFTPFNVGWKVGNCHEKYRFICTEKPYSLRSGNALSILATHLEYAFADLLKNRLKANLLRAKEYPEVEIDKMMEITREDLLGFTNGTDFIPLLPYICQLYVEPSNESCHTGKFRKGAAMIIGSIIGFDTEFFKGSDIKFMMKLSRLLYGNETGILGKLKHEIHSLSLIDPDLIRSNMKSIIPKIQNGLHWSLEKAIDAADAITKALIEELSYVPKYFLILMKGDNTLPTFY